MQNKLIDRFSELGSRGAISVDDLLQCWQEFRELHPVTPYSLTFGNNPNYQYDNLYSYFHKNKFDLFNDSAITQINMNMTAIDWNEMQINRTLRFNDELYKLVSIQNYDPINQTAQVQMIKKINNGTATARNIVTGITCTIITKMYASHFTGTTDSYSINWDSGYQTYTAHNGFSATGVTGVDGTGNVNVTVTKNV